METHFKLTSPTMEELTTEAKYLKERESAAHQRQVMEEKRTRRLIGNNSNVGQGRLFGDGDLFSF